ncbi:unnamed protein product [Bathycoccus prasinos]
MERNEKKKQLSGAQKRKKKKEKEEAIERARAELERLKLGPTKVWTGLVTHHKDVFVSHVIPEIERDRSVFLCKDVSKLSCAVFECTSISTLELAWNHFPWGKKNDEGRVMDQAYFCAQVAGTNNLELLKWLREVKQCEWDEKTINEAAFIGNLEMLKYCFSNGCPCDEEKSCEQAAIGGNLDCLRFLLDKVNPSRETEKHAAIQATCRGHVEIVKYFVEERKIPELVKVSCVYNAARYGHLDCLQYLVEEAKVPLDNWRYVACARYHEHPDCVNYLLEKGCPEPTDEQYATFAESVRALESRQENSE